MPVRTKYLTTANGRVGLHLVWEDDFIVILHFLVFWFFLMFFLFFFLVLYYILFGFMYIFMCFLSYTVQGTTGRPIPRPFTIREFSVLTRLKN